MVAEQPFGLVRALIMSMQDDEALDAFARDRSDRAFRTLYDRHAPAMYALAFRLLGGRAADAADALQDAWTRAIPRFDTFRRESSLRTWLCGFVVNCCRERLRGPLFVAVDDEVSVSSVRGGDFRVLDSIALERALAALPAGARTVVILHDIEGYTHREIAAALGIDEGTSKSQLSRGRATLRRLLAGGPNEGAASTTRY
jgi:RNA polymerase sigma-70 factor (ECF subfamily)